MEKSSLRVYMELKMNEETLEDMLLDPREYAACGGGFPIRVEEAGVVERWLFPDWIMCRIMTC